MRLRLPADVEAALFEYIMHELGGVPRCMTVLSSFCTRDAWLDFVKKERGADAHAEAAAMKGADLRTMLHNAPDWYDLATKFVRSRVDMAADKSFAGMKQSIKAHYGRLSEADRARFTAVAYNMITKDHLSSAPDGLYDAGMIYRTPVISGSFTHLVNAAASRALLGSLQAHNFIGYAGEVSAGVAARIDLSHCLTL